MAATVLTPEPSRNLRITDREWLEALYPRLEHDWWLEFRFLEDRSDRVKGPPVAVRFLRDFDEISAHLNKHRELARQRAHQMRRDGAGRWPAGLFWGVQPRRSRRGRKQDVAAFVTLVCDLDCKDWQELAEEERPRAAWDRLHSGAPTPSLVVWTGHGFHGYWLLDQPLLDKERGEAIQRDIARCLRGDQVTDCSRLLRWPHSVNYKRLMENRCRAVRPVWWHPEQRYAFETLAVHFASQGEEPVLCDRQADDRPLWKRFYSCMDRDSGLMALWRSQPTGLPTHDRSTLDMALAHSLTRHRFSADAFATITRRAPWNSRKTLTVDYLERTWIKAQRRKMRTTVSAPGKVAATDTPPPVDAPGPEPAAEGLLLHSLPAGAWTEWARLYRDAVGASTEAADEFHYVALLTVIGAVLGRTITVACGRPLHPNLYAMLVGPTGDRKSTAANLALDLLRQVAPEVLLLNGVGSQEGLMERMAEADAGQGPHSRTLLFVDEMAALLKKGRRESSGSLIEFITEIFHGPDFKTHVTRTRAIHLNRPTLSILATSTPAWLEAALEEEDILGGFTNRFVYVAAPVKPDNPLPDLPDRSRLKVLAEWILRATRGAERSMTWAPGVKERWRDFYLEWRRFTASQDERATALLRRIDLYILKFASINAAMDETTVIASRHLEAAIVLGRFLASCTYRILGDLGESKDCRLERLIEQKLTDVHGSMRRKHLRQLLGGRVTGEKLDRILRAMERNGLIRQVEQHTPKGPSRLVELTSQD